MVKFEPIKFATSAFRPGGLYIRLPWISSGFSPTPAPTGTPKTAKIKWDIPWKGTKPSDIVTVVTPEKVAEKLPSLSYEIAPWTAPKVGVSTSSLDKIWDFLNWGANNFLKYYSAKQSSKYYSKMAEAQIESEKAAKAVAEAQARIAQAQAQSQAYQKEVSNSLSKKALKKHSPYFLPIALGLAVTMVLISGEK